MELLKSENKCLLEKLGADDTSKVHELECKIEALEFVFVSPDSRLLVYSYQPSAISMAHFELTVFSNHCFEFVTHQFLTSG
jgi:hypothetical protein